MTDEIERLVELAKTWADKRAPRVEVYQRHCGNPECRCESMLDVEDENGDYVRAKRAAEVEDVMHELALFVRAVGRGFQRAEAIADREWHAPYPIEVRAMIEEEFAKIADGTEKP